MVNAETGSKLYVRVMHCGMHTLLHSVGTALRASQGEN